MLGQAAVPQQVDVYAVRRDALPGRREAEPLPDVLAAVAPHDGDLVPLGDQMLDRERGIERRPDHADALLQALHSLRLSRKRVVLDVVWPCDLVQHLQPALVADLLVESLNDPLVLIL